MSTAREMASRNITSNALAPGFIPTELTSIVTEPQRKYMYNNVGRFDNDEVAAPASSAQRRLYYGQVLSVDGGMSMQ
ncbi:hypothetical protein KDK_45080 [Dictyobacter kobayashii]|uniref:3-oxoacyl-ACP reductase n=1 Tax=Dictyobacter kobayashii TaxID=2014872 RepID=A0A402AND9_9CHLR|nr:hypothetical protein [Dictyobacter kobayashii]GCE20708.1 hypothetical protein KDK_45080 [Dictyobacter kobayashii]